MSIRIIRTDMSVLKKGDGRAWPRPNADPGSPAARLAGRRRPRGRRRTYLPAADRRAQILQVAKEVFARRGVVRSNVADICRAAGIGRGTLYQYFDNKQDVLFAVLGGIADRVAVVIERRPRIAELGGIRRAPRELIVSFCRTRTRELLDAVFADEATLRLVLRDTRGLDGAVDEMRARIDEKILDAMEQDLRAAQQAGVLRRGDPRLVARFLLGGVEKVVLDALVADEPVDLDKLVEQAVDLELFGLLQEPAGPTGGKGHR
jgi:AcrR family transcriptional regulator